MLHVVYCSQGAAVEVLYCSQSAVYQLRCCATVEVLCCSQGAVVGVVVLQTPMRGLDDAMCRDAHCKASQRAWHRMYVKK